MALNHRQQTFYKQTFDVWRLQWVNPDTGPVTGTQADQDTYVMIYTSVPGRNQTTRYNSEVGPLGRVDSPNYMTRNDQHFAYDISEWATGSHFGVDRIADEDIIVDTTENLPLLNCFSAVGEGEFRPSAVANYQHFDTIRFEPAGTNIASYYD